MKTVVITGSGGFLGRNLLREFRDDVRVIAASSKERRGESERGNVEFIQNASLRTLKWDDVDVLINCAYPRSSTNFEIADGLSFIQSVLSNAVDGGVRSVVNISSQSVYSQKRTEAATEDTKPCLESTYAIGKYASELLTDSICGKLRHTNLRMASLLGVGFEPRLVNRFIRKALNGEQIVITGGNQIFDFLDVRDAANAIARVAVSECEWNHCYNLGSSESWTLLEIVRKIEETISDQCGKRVSVEVNAGGEWQNSALDSKRFYAEFVWQPRITMQQTIEDIIDNAKED